MRKHFIIYITYDGILEPLGESQVLRYMIKLSKYFNIVLISFEKKSDWINLERRTFFQKKILTEGIEWVPLMYHKKFTILATLFDVIIGVITCILFIIKYGVKLIHVRSYVPALIGFTLKKLLGTKLIFDMRGFWVDERVDGGLWKPNGNLYHISKVFEQKLLINSDVIISLTYSAVSEMKKFEYLNKIYKNFKVIPTCTDLKLFCNENYSSLKLESTLNPIFTMGYLGSADLWYLFDEVLVCFKILKSIITSSKIYIVNKGNHDFILEKLKQHNIQAKDFILESLDSEKIPGAIKRMDIGVFFIKPLYSKIASSPTKFAEFLGCGIPCLVNSGIGDLENIVNSRRVGVVINEFDHQTIFKGLKDLLLLKNDITLRDRCFNAAIEIFDINEAVQSYKSIYEKLLEH
jgi:hypothetical protein